MTSLTVLPCVAWKINLHLNDGDDGTKQTDTAQEFVRVIEIYGMLKSNMRNTKQQRTAEG